MRFLYGIWQIHVCFFWKQQTEPHSLFTNSHVSSEDITVLWISFFNLHFKRYFTQYFLLGKRDARRNYATLLIAYALKVMVLFFHHPLFCTHLHNNRCQHSLQCGRNVSNLWTPRGHISAFFFARGCTVSGRALSSLAWLFHCCEK